jgi:hypothetical protein
MMVCSGWVRFAKRQFQRAFDGFESSWANTLAVAAAELSMYHPRRQQERAPRLEVDYPNIKR